MGTTGTPPHTAVAAAEYDVLLMRKRSASSRPSCLLHQRLGAVEPAPVAHDPLAQRAQVARLGLRALLARRP